MPRNVLLGLAFAAAFPAAALAAPSPGQALYSDNCAACHQAGGKGVKGAFPSLVGTPMVQGEARPMISMVLNGKTAMPAFKDDLSDADLASLMSYVRTAWGNRGAPITPAQVAAARRKR